jgi:hypothetical protein
MRVSVSWTRPFAPVGVLAIVALGASNAAADQCSFFDAATNQSSEEACTVAYDGDREVIALSGRQFVFVTEARQGQWAAGSLDGQPAMRYEIDRSTYSYATRDLKRFLDLSTD